MVRSNLPRSRPSTRGRRTFLASLPDRESTPPDQGGLAYVLRTVLRWCPLPAERGITPLLSPFSSRFSCSCAIHSQDSPMTLRLSSELCRDDGRLAARPPDTAEPAARLRSGVQQPAPVTPLDAVFNAGTVCID